MENELKLEYAGFWVRYGAWWIDCLIIVPILFGLNAAYTYYIPVHLRDASLLSSLNFVLNTFLGIYYWAILQHKWQATIGKRVMGLTVINTDRSRPSLKQFVIRYFISLISMTIFFLGYLSVAFNDRKRGWHDMTADTFVVYKSSLSCPFEKKDSEKSTNILIAIFLLMLAGFGSFAYNMDLQSLFIKFSN